MHLILTHYILQHGITLSNNKQYGPTLISKSSCVRRCTKTQTTRIAHLNWQISKCRRKQAEGLSPISFAKPEADLIHRPALARKANTDHTSSSMHWNGKRFHAINIYVIASTVNTVRKNLHKGRLTLTID